MLKKVASKGGLLGNDRITTQNRLIIGTVKSRCRCRGWIETREGCRGDRKMNVTSWSGDGALGEIPEEAFYIAQADLNLVDLSFTTRHACQRLVDELPYLVGERLSAQLHGGDKAAPSADTAPGFKDDMGVTNYWDEMRTRCRGSLGLWPTPVDVQERLAVRQLEHGQSLSHRIYIVQVLLIPSMLDRLCLQKRPDYGVFLKAFMGDAHLSRTTLITLCSQEFSSALTCKRIVT